MKIFKVNTFRSCIYHLVKVNHSVHLHDYLTFHYI